MIRTNRTHLVFDQPFSLTNAERIQPAGTYIIETDEEQIDGVTHVAFRRLATRIVLAPDPTRPGCSETADVDPRELANARVADTDEPHP